MIKNNLKIIRKNKGLTLRKLSELSGIDNSHIAKIENGKTRLNSDSLRILAKALEVSPEDLIRDDLMLEPKKNSKTKSNLTLLREKAGLTQVEIAKKLGKTKQYISLLEKDVSKINESMKEQLADILDVNKEEIKKKSADTIENQTGHKNIKSNDMINLPLYDYKLSAGKGIYRLNNAITDKDYTKIPVKIELLEKITISNINNLCLLIIDGDSMNPTFKDGDFAILDIGINELTSQGGIYAFDYDDESYLKRIQKMPNKLIIKSDNSSYDNWYIELPPKHTLKIWGKVKGSFSLNKI